MIVFRQGWDTAANNPGQATPQDIVDMTNAMAKRILDTHNPNQLALQLADDVESDDTVVTVIKGIHQLERYKGVWWAHYTVGDNTGRQAFHLYLRTDPNDIANYQENVIILSTNLINEGVVWTEV